MIQIWQHSVWFLSRHLWIRRLDSIFISPVVLLFLWFQQNSDFCGFSPDSDWSQEKISFYKEKKRQKTSTIPWKQTQEIWIPFCFRWMWKPGSISLWKATSTCSKAATSTISPKWADSTIVWQSAILIIRFTRLIINKPHHKKDENGGNSSIESGNW